MAYRYLFGPVPSRRLGISLGVDLVPPKTCTMNCVYCECGPTTAFTIDRAEYVPTDGVLAELDDFLGRYPRPDFITFSGSGEPTLHSGLGRIASHLKARGAAPVALLTNSSLLDRPDVRSEAAAADLILPSLDAVSDSAFQAINRPVAGIRSEAIIDGLAALREIFTGEIWLEIFMLAPLNTAPDELDRFRDAIRRIRPDRVQLNTLDRPGTEPWVRPVPLAELEAMIPRLGHPRVEVIARYRRRRDLAVFRPDLEHAILETIARRPCTAEDLAAGLGIRPAELNKYLDILETERRIRAEIQDRGIFYRTLE
ncbi:MAG TPA: radical SAM protein [Acidobacteriota bacterium]|nr:radical SAM protein [Acidobacteriota bacterium]HQF86903.1 radical SAM protein [Acidobacteriota bacterium]HQG91299.1 radical SAM protein [Acidobacteriota bacterium]